MVFLKEHEQNGRPSPDVKGSPSPTLEDYYRNSMPRSDLLGDVDAFEMASMVGPQTLSAALRAYYVSESGGGPRFRYNRWRGFAAATGLSYVQSGNTIAWTQLAIQTVIERITSFANLFAGRTGPIRAMTVGISPQPWPRAGEFADRFLRDVRDGIEEEIAPQTAAHPKATTCPARLDRHHRAAITPRARTTSRSRHRGGRRRS